MAGIIISGVEKAFGTVRALKGISLAIEPGEFVSLVGPSGCGKTTLMRVIAGLEAADQGQVQIGERDVTALRAAERDVAMVFQSYALYPHLTAFQNMAVPLVMRRMTSAQRLPLIGRFLPGARAARQAIAEEIGRTAGLLGIKHLLERKPGQLSGGQRQRVALGRAIVRHPLAFLMDEPLSNLDASLRVQTRKEIVELHRRVGASTVYVTHDQSEAMTMSDRVAVMMAGEILQVGTPEEIYAQPADIRVATFMGSPRINTLSGKVGEDGVVRVANEPVGLRSEIRGPVTFAIRPEDLVIADEGLPANLEHVEFLGDTVIVHARHAPNGEDLITRVAPGDRARLTIGAMIRLKPNPARAALFDAQGKRAAARPVIASPEAAHG